ncbi:hypothetical protein E1B28_001699 [Marasmius oreades]|uniref:Uncharacterized protein n=1 Tax=Marasmius oreades TaxID=181124 RepID=A0A9P8AFP8_9AGAR|nr:uncharacterized protein E1B28_001699 [Marasmius oreades]KAG7099899.1 hypothetical protein E1B28_001699 [Marasmius oreades]
MEPQHTANNDVPPPTWPTWKHIAQQLWIRTASAMFLCVSLWTSQFLFTPDSTAISTRVVIYILYLVVVLAPLSIKLPPHEWLAAFIDLTGIALHFLLGTRMTHPFPDSSLNDIFMLILKAPFFFATAHLLTASAMTFMLICIEGVFDSERMGFFGRHILWIHATVVLPFKTVKQRYTSGPCSFFRPQYNLATDTEKCLK